MTEEQKKLIEEICTNVGIHSLKGGLSHKEVFNIVISLATGMAIGMKLKYEDEADDFSKIMLKVMLDIYAEEVVSWLEKMH